MKEKLVYVIKGQCRGFKACMEQLKMTICLLKETYDVCIVVNIEYQEKKIENVNILDELYNDLNITHQNVQNFMSRLDVPVYYICDVGHVLKSIFDKIDDDVINYYTMIYTINTINKIILSYDVIIITKPDVYIVDPVIFCNKICNITTHAQHYDHIYVISAQYVHQIIFKSITEMIRDYEYSKIKRDCTYKDAFNYYLGGYNVVKLPVIVLSIISEKSMMLLNKK